MTHHREGKDAAYFPRTALIMSHHREGKDTAYFPRMALIMSHYREGKDTCLFAAYGTHHSPTRRRKDHYLPLTALIMSHMGVKIPSANTNTMTATIPIRMGSMRAVRLLRS